MSIINPSVKFPSRHKPLFWLMIAMIFTTIFATVGLFTDSREVLGFPNWIKTVKFSTSITLYCGTLLLMTPLVTKRKKLWDLFLWGSTIVLAVEIGIIILQAFRGQSVHFNASSSFDMTLFSIMGAFIYTLFGITIGATILLMFEPIGHRVIAWAIRLGFIATLAGGYVVGTMMTVPTSAQVDAIAETGFREGVTMGQHSRGGEDGGAGLPMVGWSTEHGDLRVGHFFGLHSLQLIPLLGLAIAKRYSSWKQSSQLQLLSVGAFGYMGWVALVIWQALRGQPFLSPDAITIGALIALVVAVTASAVVIYKKA